MKDYEKIILKIMSYLLSLIPLIVIFLIKGISKILELQKGDSFLCFVLILGIIYILLILIGLIIRHSKRKGSRFIVNITNVRNNNTDQILFLVTYLIPLVAVDYDKLTFIQLIVILVFMGFIYCKTNLFSANPFLSLLGWNIYKANIKNKQIDEDVIIMTRKSIKELEGMDHSGLHLIDEEVILVI